MWILMGNQGSSYASQAKNCIKCNILLFYLSVLHRFRVCKTLNVKKKSYHPRALLSLHANLGQTSEQVQIKPRTVLSKGLLEKMKLPGCLVRQGLDWLAFNNSLWFEGLGFCFCFFFKGERDFLPRGLFGQDCVEVKCKDSEDRAAWHLRFTAS